MSHLIFITGGARSGKSNLAIQLAEESGGRVAFIATARAGDEEMAKRILVHKKTRPREWITIEEPIDVASAITAAHAHGVLIIDCLTLLLSNLMLENNGASNSDEVLDKVRELIEAAESFEGTMIVVSNEVGMG